MKPIDLSGGVSARRCIVLNPSNIFSLLSANLRCLVSRFTAYLRNDKKYEIGMSVIVIFLIVLCLNYLLPTNTHKFHEW